MSSKSTRRSAAPSSSAAHPVRDSAHEIWLAGLGAFTKAQQEGSKMFDALVQEGLTMQRKAQTSAEEKLAEASHKMSHMAQDIGTRATGQWDKLEGLFEERVARALQRLGMPSSQAVHALAQRLEALEKRAAGKPASPVRAAPVKKAAAKKKAAPAKKAARKTTR